MTVGLYRLTRRGLDRAALLETDSSGMVRARLEIPSHKNFVERLLGEGVIDAAGRRLTPSDGDRFLTSVLETVQTSYWRAWDEHQGGHPKPLRKGVAGAVAAR